MSIIIKIITTRLLFIMVLLILSVVVVGFFLNVPEESSIMWFKIVSILVIFIFFFGLFKIVSFPFFSNRLFVYLMLIMAFILRLWWIISVKTEPISDLALLYETALQISEGNFEGIQTNNYFNVFYQNIPFTIFQAGILYLYKSIFLLKFLNVVLGTGIVYLIYKIVQHFSSEKVARFTGTIVVLYPPFIVYTSVLTNQTLSIFLTLLALYLFFKKKNLVIISLLFCLAYLIRPTAIVFFGGIIASIIIWAIFFEKEDPLIIRVKSLALSLLKLVAPFVILFLLISIVMTTTSISRHSFIENPIPNYKLLVGLNHETSGAYSDDDAKLTSDLVTYKQIADARIYQRLENDTKIASLFVRKFKTFWGDKDGATYWAFPYDNREKKNVVRGILDLYEQIIYAFLIFYAFMCVFQMANGNLHIFNFDKLLPIAIMLISFIFIYLFIEIQTRYRYEIYPLIFFLAGPGVELAYNNLFLNKNKA